MFFRTILFIFIMTYPASALAVASNETTDSRYRLWAESSVVERQQASLQVKRIQRLLKNNEIRIEKVFESLPKRDLRDTSRQEM